MYMYACICIYVCMYAHIYVCFTLSKNTAFPLVKNCETR